MTFTDLNRVVQALLASKRLGDPVFVRCTVQGPFESDALVDRLARLTGLMSGWFGQRLERLHALGTPASGHVSLTLQFQNGASAAISYARGQVLGEGFDLMLLGSRGAAYRDAFAAAPAGRPLDFAPADQAAPEKHVRAIRRALETGKPVPVATEAKP